MKTCKEIYTATFSARYITLCKKYSTDKASRIANIFAVKATWFLFNNQNNPEAYAIARRKFG